MCLYVQADHETRWQLIQCNVNEILDQTLASQRHHITQKIKPSTLCKPQDPSTDSAISWWRAARSPLEPVQVNEDTQLSKYDAIVYIITIYYC